MVASSFGKISLPVNLPNIEVQNLSRRRDYPYFKFQVFSETSLTWLENKKTFESVESLKLHLSEEKVIGKVKLIRVDENGYTDIGEPESLGQ